MKDFFKQNFFNFYFTSFLFAAELVRYVFFTFLPYLSRPESRLLENFIALYTGKPNLIVSWDEFFIPFSYLSIHAQLPSISADIVIRLIVVVVLILSGMIGSQLRKPNYRIEVVHGYLKKAKYLIISALVISCFSNITALVTSKKINSLLQAPGNTFLFEDLKNTVHRPFSSELLAVAVFSIAAVFFRELCKNLGEPEIKPSETITN